MLTALMGVLVIAQYAPTGSMVQPTARSGTRARLGDPEVLGAIGARDANLIEAAKLATTKASGADVKTFAGAVLDLHEQSLTRGADLAKALNVSRTLPADSAMARMQETKMDEMALLSGAAFDRVFVQYVYDAYDAEIGKTLGPLQAQAQHATVKAFLTERLPALRTHYATASAWLAAHRP